MGREEKEKKEGKTAKEKRRKKEEKQKIIHKNPCKCEIISLSLRYNNNLKHRTESRTPPPQPQTPILFSIICKKWGVAQPN